MLIFEKFFQVHTNEYQGNIYNSSLGRFIKVKLFIIFRKCIQECSLEQERFKNLRKLKSFQLNVILDFELINETCRYFNCLSLE